MDRQLQIQILLDHYQKPRHRGTLEDADVAMPGGNPGCGDVVTVYLKGAEDHEHIAGVSYEGEGCTISMAASSMLLEQVVEGDLTMDKVLEFDYNEMIDQLGRQIVASRPRCATLGLGTLKHAIWKYQRDRRLDEAGVSRPEGPPSDEGGLVFGEGAAEAAHKDQSV
ncbi:MAG: iron-sulfur cluster assembly scaffold protein [Actinobacteria bacterium]|nr:iron-sulfur cluster assembly scaffold protein [Actinomycetota bacterium]